MNETMQAVVNVVRICSHDAPEQIHVWSLYLLHTYFEGKVEAGELLRKFALPNSDLLPMVDCMRVLIERGWM